MLRRETDQTQDLHHALGVRARGEPVQRERLGERLPDRHPRIERRERVLEDDLHGAPLRAHRRLGQREDVFAVEVRVARGRLEQAQHQPARRRLAAAGLADERQRLADRDVEAHAVDRAHRARRAREETAPHGKVLDEPQDAQQRHRRSCHHAAPAIVTSSGARQHAAS